MKYIILIFLFVIKYTISQFENGITFADITTTTTMAPQPNFRPYGCACYPPLYCRGSKIDPRIATPYICYPGYTLCCPLPYPSTPAPSAPPPPLQPVCGNRSVINPRQLPLNGQASYGEYPWTGAILELNNNYLGGAVLLNKQYALTAAHKVFDVKNAKVRFGVINNQKIELEAREYLVKNIIVHPDYDPFNLKNDIAVLALNDEVEFSMAVTPACLPNNPNLVIEPWTYCWVSGWGKDSFSQQGTYQTLQKSVKVPIVDNKICEKQLRTTRLGPYFILDSNNFICAGGYTSQDACTGDGGSPLVCELTNGVWTVIGLVSWGIQCGEPGIPGVYVNVASFFPWIQSQIGAT